MVSLRPREAFAARADIAGSFRPMKVKSFLVSGSGMLGSQMISLLSLPLLTRLFEPTAYAQWAIVQAVVLFVGAIASFRYDLAIVVEREDLAASALFWLATVCGFLVALVTALVLTALNLTDVVHDEWVTDGGALFLTLVWVACATISPAIMGWCLRKGRFAVISATQVAIAATTLAVQTTGGLQSSGNASWKWLLVGSICGQIVGLAVLCTQFSLRDDRPEPLQAIWRTIASAGRQHFNFVKFSLPYTVFGAVRDRLPLFVVSSWASPRDLGLYSQSWRLSNVPAGLTGAVIRPVIFHASAAGGLPSLEETINRILLLLILVGIPPLALIIVFPTDIVGWVLGDRWRDVGAMIAPMLVPAFVFSISNWMDRLLDSAGRQDVNLLTEMVSAVTTVSALLVALSTGLGIQNAILAQSATLTINYLIYIYVVYKIAGYNINKLGLIFCAAALLFGIVFLSANLIVSALSAPT